MGRTRPWTRPESGSTSLLRRKKSRSRETRTTIWELVTTLPADQRRVVELRLAGLTGAEIAKSMGRSRLAVKMLQFRAISALRRRLGATKQEDAQEANRDHL